MGDNRDVSGVRREYQYAGLDRSALSSDPVVQFSHWMDEALAADPGDATSMTLATADATGYPSARIVLLKGFDQQGFTWFTNYRSEKGKQLEENPCAELLFYWKALERQVRIRGRVIPVSREESVEYFNSRPLGSQIGAVASHQSQPIGGRELLEQEVERLTKVGSVECPDHWGGFRLVPERFEFWQGRESRLHDRFRYSATDTGWHVERLQP